MASSAVKILDLSRRAFKFITVRKPLTLLSKSQSQTLLGPWKRKLAGSLMASVLTVALCECRTCGSSKGSSSSCFDCGKKPDRSCKCAGAGGNGSCSTCLPASSDQKPLHWEKQDLTHCYLLKQANIVTTDSITRIMSETISAFEDYHCQYRHLLEMLMELMEDSRCAPEARQELLNCKMIVIRSSIEDVKKSIIELECYLDSVSRLAHASAETAFLANAEYASIALMERLNSTMIKVNEIKNKTLEIERSANELQALIIVESGKGLK